MKGEVYIMAKESDVTMLDERYDEALVEVIEELVRLKKLVDDPDHPFENLYSPHHGWALLHEEMDELWEEIRKKNKDRDKDAMREEAMQIAALAIRFMTDLT
jgi:NTP pyrophosphatase (non-canonical NTP hydrolase)